MKKKLINLININADINKKVINKVIKKKNKNSFFIGPWCNDDKNFFLKKKIIFQIFIPGIIQRKNQKTQIL